VEVSFKVVDSVIDEASILDHGFGRRTFSQSMVSSASQRCFRSGGVKILM